MHTLMIYCYGLRIRVVEWCGADPCSGFDTFKFVAGRYIATIDGAVNKRHLLALSEGTVIDGVHCTPDVVELLPQQPDILRSRLRIVVLFYSQLLHFFSFLLFLGVESAASVPRIIL